jgi:hypothetical protein
MNSYLQMLFSHLVPSPFLVSMNTVNARYLDCLKLREEQNVKIKMIGNVPAGLLQLQVTDILQFSLLIIILLTQSDQSEAMLRIIHALGVGEEVVSFL